MGTSSTTSAFASSRRSEHAIEAHFGRPQDIEWAIDSSKLWIVQSRDITTLYPIPSGAPDPERDLRVYLSVNVAQGVFQPFTPMGIQTFRLIGAAFASAVGRPVAESAAGPSVMADAGMRLWIDLTGALRNAATREIPVRVFSIMEARSSGIVARLLDDPRLAPRRGSRLRSVATILRAVAHAGVPPWVIRALLHPDRTRDRVLSDVDALITRDVGPLTTPAERLDAFEGLIITTLPRIFPRLVATVAAGLASYNFAARLLRGVASDDEMRTCCAGCRSTRRPRWIWSSGPSRAARETIRRREQRSRTAIRTSSARSTVAARYRLCSSGSSRHS